MFHHRNFGLAPVVPLAERRPRINWWLIGAGVATAALWSVIAAIAILTMVVP